MALTVLKLRSVLQQSRLSPESLASHFGMSGMTVRRWMERPDTDVLPERFHPAIRDAILKLVSKDVLSIDSTTVQEILREAEMPAVDAALHGLGITLDDLQAASSTGLDAPEQEEAFMDQLARIGSDPARQASVNDRMSGIERFKAMGAEWTSRIDRLVAVITSKDLALAQKLVAFGALFYLFTPFDLIPDHVPVFGFMDDFGVLGYAITYYAKRLGDTPRS